MHFEQAPHSANAAAITLLGIPFDGGSTYLRGAAGAPPLIREALYCDASNLWSEDGANLGDGVFHDIGDVAVPPEPAAAIAPIAAAVQAALALNRPLISLGGDHSVTYPILRAFHTRHQALTILHLDAHPDLYDELNGRYSHACPFARIMEEGLARRLVQVGIRTMNGHQAEQARRFGVEVISMRHLERLAQLQLEGPLYISFDLDVLDPAFAPGISHHEPGGLAVRDTLRIFQGLRVPIVGADIVEYNPQRDRDMQSAMVCAKVLKEIAAAILRKGRAPAEGWV